MNKNQTKLSLILCILFSNLNAATYVNNTANDINEPNATYDLKDYSINHNISVKNLNISNSLINQVTLNANSLSLNNTNSISNSTVKADKINLINNSNLLGNITGFTNDIVQEIVFDNSTLNSNNEINIEKISGTNATIKSNAKINNLDNSLNKLNLIGEENKKLNVVLHNASNSDKLYLQNTNLTVEQGTYYLNNDITNSTIIHKDTSRGITISDMGFNSGVININNSSIEGISVSLSGALKGSKINNSTIISNDTQKFSQSNAFDNLYADIDKTTIKSVNSNVDLDFVFLGGNITNSTLDLNNNNLLVGSFAGMQMVGMQASNLSLHAEIISDINKLINYNLIPLSTNAEDTKLSLITKNNATINNIDLNNVSFTKDTNIKANTTKLSDSIIDGIINTNTIELINTKTLENAQIITNESILKNSDLNDGNLTSDVFNIDNVSGNANLISNNKDKTSSITNSKSNLNLDLRLALIQNSEVGTAIIDKFDVNSKNVLFKGKLTTSNDFNTNNFDFLDDVEVKNADFYSSSHKGYKNVNANNIYLDFQDTNLNGAYKLEAKNQIIINNIKDSDYLAKAKEISIKDSTFNSIDFTDKLTIDNSTIKGEITNSNSLSELIIKNNSVLNGLINVDSLLISNSNKANIFNKSVVIGDFAKDSKNNIFNNTLYSKKNIYADDNIFNSKITALDTLYASKSNTFNDVNAYNVNFVGSGLIEFNNNDLLVNNEAFIMDMDLNAYNVLINKADIKNSNIMAYLQGNLEKPINNPANIYKPNITSGEYNLSNMSNKGGIRANIVNVDNSHLVGQFASNNLNSSNTNYYLLGGGIDTTLYESFSGAIISRKNSTGETNKIRIKDTNILGLTQGLVPVAILKEQTQSLNKDYFKLSYIRGTNLYSFNENMEHYKKFITSDGLIYHVWLVGSVINGDIMGELNKDNIKGVAEGTDESFNAAIIANGNANANTSPKDTNVNTIYNEITNTTQSDVILKYDEEAGLIFKGLDKATGEAIEEINNLPLYLSKIIADNNKQILNNTKHGLGFWYHAYTGKSSTNLSKLNYKGISFGLDKVINNKNYDLYYGLLAGSALIDVSKTINASIDAKTAGLYSTAIFNNGLFIDTIFSYSSLHNMVDNNVFKAVDTKNYIIQSNTKLGFKYEDNLYIEPSIGFNVSYLPSDFMQRDITNVKKYKKTLMSIEPEFKVGYKNNGLNIYSSLSIEKDLNESPYLEIEDDYVIVQRYGLKDFRLKTNCGIDYDFAKNSNIKFDFSKDFRGFYMNDYKINLEVRHYF